MLEFTPLHHSFSPDHEQFRAALRDFVSREITPCVNAWDEAGAFPRSLYRSAAELGALGVGFPEVYGGTPADVFFKIVLAEEFARCGSGGVVASLNSHTIGLPQVLAAGSETLKCRVIPPVLRGEEIAALAVTEPSGGSDVAAVKATAVRDGDYYVVNGEKTFVCRVPVANLVGEEHQGVKTFMNNFNSERLFMSAQAYAFAQVCFEEALNWARERRTFGLPLIERQVIRHKLVDMALRIDAARSLVHELAYRIEHRLADPQQLVARIAMAKVFASQAMQFCADQAVQILGGMGFMRGTRSERIYREAKVMMIGGGSEEILKDLAARQLGL